LRDRTAAKLEVDPDVVGDRRRGLEGGDELRRGVDERDPLADVREVRPRLAAARGRAGADRYEQPRLGPYLLDALEVVRRRDRALHEGDVVRPIALAARRLGEVRDLDALGDREELVLAVEERALAAVA